MTEFEYEIAESLNDAWLNFELDLPLRPLADGRPNPFYTNRPGDPAAELEDALLAPFFKPPKFFFSGHRGCGKSTELRRLAGNLDIQEKYWTVHFTIRDVADINDLDYRDILLAVGSQMYRQYKDEGNMLPKQLIKELDSWYGKVVTEITTSGSRISGFEIGGGIDALFAKAGLKMKLEPKTRSELRQVLERNVTGLIQVINDISLAIQSKVGKLPLILIDDLDKPDLVRAKEIFYAQRESMLQPNCAVVYTVSSALFYSSEFEAIRDQAVFLPNVKLHDKGKPEILDEDGYVAMRLCIHKRMHANFTSEEAVNTIIVYSGGVFRELARLMRAAIGRARRRKSGIVELEDAEWAGAEIRNEYRRILDAADLTYLQGVKNDNMLRNHPRLRPLLQLLALLEYRNGRNWCDVHPTLDQLLAEISPEELVILQSEIDDDAR